MSTELYQKVYDFLANSSLEHIIASSVIFQVIEEEPWITKEESRSIVNNAINASLNIYSSDTPAQNKLLRILVQVSFFRFSKPMIRLNKWWMARIESQVVGIIVLFHSLWVEDIILKKREERLNYILVQTPLLIFRYFDILQMPFFVVDRTMITLQSSDEERVGQKMHFYYRSWSNSGFSLRQFDDAFEGVFSLRDIGAVKLVCYFFYTKY